MFDDLRADLKRYHGEPGPLPAGVVFRLLGGCSGSQANLTYRCGRWLRRNLAHVWAWPAMALLALPYAALVVLVRAGYDIRLDLSADIGPGFRIGHLGGIRVSGCRIGRHCSIQQEVRIAPAAPGETGPDIGDRVWIGAHARLIGALHVGAGATIAAGAVVTTDVAPGCLMLGNPARVARWGYNNAGIL